MTPSFLEPKPSFLEPKPSSADPSITLGRAHVESEQSLFSVVEFPKAGADVPGFLGGSDATAQWLSGDRQTGESTQRLEIRKGWKAPLGHFTADVEVFVLSGEVRNGGFRLRNLCYSYIPAGIVTGPWEATEDTVLLFMPDRKPQFESAPYAALAQTPENACCHRNTQTSDAMARYVPCKEINSMPWQQTTFLPPGSARKSLFTCEKTGRATWILGLVPMWIEGNFLAGHPTTEEAYLISGDVQGHWSMQDAPFERRYAPMRRDGYYWRPAHVPHGPFWSETGALCLFRTGVKLDCHWQLHSHDITQRGG